jgi:hypothetical protein
MNQNMDSEWQAFCKIEFETIKYHVMKITKQHVWTLESKSVKSPSSKMQMKSIRKVCSSKNGFDAALLQLGVSIMESEKKTVKN